ncbi:MAG: type II secretion system protein [Patescibacteria group bacterium]|nr:type II secretion system protein [Patescibacteria group bacterium]
MNNKNQKKGFTLIEVLLVIGIIAILAAVVIIAINPAKQLAQARNAQRWSNVNTILNAVHQYAVDNRGILPVGITTTAKEICNTPTVASSSCASLANLWELTLNESYLTALPKDPSCPGANCDTNGIGYQIVQSVNGRVTVMVPTSSRELGEIISVTR